MRSLQFAAMAAGLVLFGAVSVQAQTVTIHGGSATGKPKDTVMFDVTITTGGLAAVGTQNDITFTTDTPIDGDATNGPTCTVNPAIGREATSFAFQPAGCTPGTDCTGIRAIVLSFHNLTPIADGAKLYTCSVTIKDGAPDGNYTLSLTGASASDKDGNSLPTESTDGQIVVSGGVPTDPADILIGSAHGNDGDTVTFDTTLTTTAAPVGTQNDITFSPETPIDGDATNGPTCAVNPAIGREATSFAFLPSGCTPGTDCTGVRAIVLSFHNLNPIATGSTLYTCTVKIKGDAPDGNYPLVCSGASSSDKDGGEIVTGCTNGKITVGGVLPGDSTLAEAITAAQTTIPLTDASTFPASGTVKIDDELITYTGKDGNTLTGATRGAGATTHAMGAAVSLQQVVPATSTATATVRSTPTSTVKPETTSTSTRTATATATRTPTVTVTGGTSTPKPTSNIIDDDGCAIVSPSDTQTGWLLLLPAAMLLWLRRRAR